MAPSPPARDTAAVIAGEEADPIPPSAIGCSISNKSQIGVRIIQPSHILNVLPDSLAHRLSFHFQLGTETCQIAVYRSDCKNPPFTFVFEQTILGLDIAVDCDLVPVLGVPDIVYRHVVVLTPEERHRVESLTLSQHVERGGLSLAFRDHPMLDSDCLAAIRIGPAGDVACGIDTADAGFE